MHRQRLLTRPGRAGLAVLAGLLAAACGPARGETGVRAGVVVDSVRDRALALARFRAGTTAPAGLDGGAASRDQLVERWAGALAASDAEALARLALSRREFGWLYYPSAPMAAPPYDLEPELLWYRVATHGARGLADVLRAAGGGRWRVLGYSCPPEPAVEGENRIHAPCVVRLAGPSGRDTIARRLFGPIVEHDGRFKFLNLAARVD